MMQDMQGSNQVGNKKYYINGKEVSPEELAQLTQQGGEITLLNKVRKLFNKQHKDNKGATRWQRQLFRTNWVVTLRKKHVTVY